MEKFNLIFKFTNEKYELHFQCTEFPTKKELEELEESVEKLSAFGLGKIKKISIIPLDSNS